MNETYELHSARQLAAEMQERIIRPGDTVVDATLGNGHDACRLASLVGPQGKLIGFDIQRQAIESSRARLREAGLEERSELCQTGHEHMAEYVTQPVRCVVFNLGWLPGGDKSVTTRWTTTEKAISAAMQLVVPLGIITICAYPGHEEGDVERAHLTQWLASLPPQAWNVLHCRFANAGPGAPECWILQKQRGSQKKIRTDA